MTSPRSLRFTPQGRNDVRSILRYSRRTWGARQGEMYARRLTAVMQDMTTFPYLGRSREDIGPGLRGHPTGMHIIYYRVEDGTVTIIRVLHAKVDAVRELNEP